MPVGCRAWYQCLSSRDPCHVGRTYYSNPPKGQELLQAVLLFYQITLAGPRCDQGCG
jgi:hypothetical protein